MLVDSVMSRSVVTAEPPRSVQSAARLMRQGRFRHLPVLVRGHLVAMVSDRDLTATGERHTIREVMHTGVISVTPDTPPWITCSALSVVGGHVSTARDSRPRRRSPGQLAAGLVIALPLFGQRSANIGTRSVNDVIRRTGDRFTLPVACVDRLPDSGVPGS